MMMSSVPVMASKLNGRWVIDGPIVPNYGTDHTRTRLRGRREATVPLKQSMPNITAYELGSGMAETVNVKLEAVVANIPVPDIPVYTPGIKVRAYVLSGKSTS